jgi:two-component system LytT family response regulator
MNPVKALIADDERLAREYLKQLLACHAGIEIIGECRNGVETVNAIFSLQPGLVFLDIQMPDLNGFDVIREVQKEMSMPAIVFTTAYEEFALKAFDVSAVDYLLKPFTEERFSEAITKALGLMEKNRLSETNAAIETLLKLYNQKKESRPLEIYPSRILVKANKRIFFVSVEDIIWLEASGDYVKIHLKDAHYLLNDSLNNIEQTLDPQRFIRVHRSHMVNLECITEFKPYFNGEYILVMNNRQEVKLSRSYKDKMKTLLGKDSL